MLATRPIPAREHLVDYNHAVAGHAGTMCDPDGELFIKPCVQTEIDFYQSVRRRHPEFAEIMPEFLGTLTLSDPADLSSIEDGVVGPVAAAAIVAAASELAEGTPDPLQQEEQPGAAAEAAQAAGTTEKDNITWVPNKSKKIKTDQAVVLENASSGFRHPNIVDVKLGVRLWADDAPLQKKQRFDKISAETTHRDFGFRIAGMRAYRGSADEAELDAEGYKIYDKDFGRLHVNNDNVVDAFRRFVFNETAGVDEALGKAVCAAFARDIRRVEQILARHETRMYSASLLLVFEGDGEALRQAIGENNAAVEAAEETRSVERAVARKMQPERTTARIDSGIGMADDDGEDLGEDGFDEDDEEEDAPALPKIYSLKLIDFAHAKWTPGQGPDENSLKGVRSLGKIFDDLS